MALVPGHAKNGGYVNINQTFWSSGYMLETVNASINIVMYYRMSTRYRTTLQDLICAKCFSSGDADNSLEHDEDGSSSKKHIPN